MFSFLCILFVIQNIRHDFLLFNEAVQILASFSDFRSYCTSMWKIMLGFKKNSRIKKRKRRRLKIVSVGWAVWNVIDLQLFMIEYVSNTIN